MTVPVNQILLGDCLDVLKTLPDDSVDSIITDPPYGLGTKEPTTKEIISYLSEVSNLDLGGDFMGHDWTIPSVAVWKECYRVLKPGGHLLSFGGTRTFDLISLGIRAAGFENRDTIASQFGVTVLQWVQSQGFPKSLNVEKALLKAGVASEIVNKFTGLGTALKPSWEPILVFRKPIEEKTIAEQVLATGTGALNIDACRIFTLEKLSISTADPFHNKDGSQKWNPTSSGVIAREQHTLGRWPANLVFVHSSGCKLVGYKKVPAPVINRWADGAKPFGGGSGHPFSSEQTGDAEGMEKVPVYECEEGCPVKILDEQSGDLDSGGASRFFGQIQPEAAFFYCGKVSPKERNKGLGQDSDNFHSTVKPLKLMEWLVKLVTPKGAVVLDPFCGSGTTCIAALNCDCKYIGIEKDPKFFDISVNRIKGLTFEIEDKAVERRQEEAFELLFDLPQETNNDE